MSILNRQSILFFLAYFFSSQLMAQEGSAKAYDEVSRKIGAGDCSGAETIARSNLLEPMLYTVLGFIQLDCRKNKKSAITYFMISAKQNESLAIDKLIDLGEIPPIVSQGLRPTAIVPAPLPAPPPMPTIIQGPPTTIYVTPQIQVQPMNNLNACIQDGGPIFCPNHPNTRIRR